jgi:hypothetical protein
MVILPWLFGFQFFHSAQPEIEKGKNSIRFDQVTYKVGDTIQATFQFRDWEVLHSNFGGCGSDAYYWIECPEDSLKNYANLVSCDMLIEEFSYSSSGTIEFVARESGTFVLNLFVKKSGEILENEADRFKNIYVSEIFVVENK